MPVLSGCSQEARDVLTRIRHIVLIEFDGLLKISDITGRLLNHLYVFITGTCANNFYTRIKVS